MSCRMLQFGRLAGARLINVRGWNLQTCRSVYAVAKRLPLTRRFPLADRHKIWTVGSLQKRWGGAAKVGESSRCPSCAHVNEVRGAAICSTCGNLQPIEQGEENHFALLGLEASFDVDRDRIEAAYKEMQRMLHPDRHVASGEAQAALAEAHSARLNKAVAILRSPLQRGRHWMELHGIRVLEEDQRMDSASTMMEVMEISEALEDAKTQAEVDSIAASLEANIREVEALLSGVFEEQDWSLARTHLERLQMLTRLLQRSHDWRGS